MSKKTGHRDYRRALYRLFDKAERNGKNKVTVACKGLLAEVDTDTHQAMVASVVMWMEAAQGQCRIRYSPPSGQGPKLEITYWLPRHRSPYGET